MTFFGTCAIFSYQRRYAYSGSPRIQNYIEKLSLTVVIIQVGYARRGGRSRGSAHSLGPLIMMLIDRVERGRLIGAAIATQVHFLALSRFQQPRFAAINYPKIIYDP